MKRVLSLLLVCSLTLTGVAIAAPTALAGTIPMTWKPMDKAYVVFEMDSSPAGAEVITFNNILQEYGFPMCVSTTTHSMGPIKVLSLHEVENHGGEITSHTHSGKVLNSYVPWEDVEYEFKTSLDIFRQHDFNVNGIMLMGGGGQNQPDPTKREDTTEKYRAEIEKHGLKLFGVLPQDDAVYRCDCIGEPSAKLPDSDPMKVALKGIMQSIGL